MHDRYVTAGYELAIKHLKDRALLGQSIEEAIEGMDVILAKLK